MAKIKIAGEAYVVESTLTLEAIQSLEKAKSKALILFEKNEEGKKEEVFRIGTTSGKGSINEFGASFGGHTHDAAKKACITGCIPEGTEDAKEWVAEKIGYAIIRLNEVEKQVPGALEELNAKRTEVMENISVM